MQREAVRTLHTEKAETEGKISRKIFFLISALEHACIINR
jgi:hypothetical protein